MKTILQLTYNISDIKLTIIKQQKYQSDLALYFNIGPLKIDIIKPSSFHYQICLNTRLVFSAKTTTVYHHQGPKMYYRILTECTKCQSFVDGNLIVDKDKRKLLIPNSKMNYSVFQSTSQTWCDLQLLKNCTATL